MSVNYIMHYKYAPIYKYGLFMLLIYMFFKHQRIMTPNKLLVNSLMITLFFVILDYILIDGNPPPFETDQSKKNKEIISDDELEDIIIAFDDDPEEKYEDD